MGVSRKALVDAVQAQLDTVPNAVGWLGEPDGRVPVKDDGLTVAPHWILYPSPGTPSDELDLGDTVDDLDWLVQVTCVTGDPVDLMPLVGRVDSALYRWSPTIDGVTCGVFRPPLGFDPGAMRVDQDIDPHRYYLPLQYTARVTTN